MNIEKCKRVFFLKVRGLFQRLHLNYKPKSFDMITEPDEVSNLIIGMINKGGPFMIARYGSLELLAIRNYLSIIQKKRSLLKYAVGRDYHWWWDEYVLNAMENNAGFFPANPDTMKQFGELMINSSSNIDVLGCWTPDEYYMKPFFNKSVKYIKLLSLEPYWSSHPWTKALIGKKVLVVHPFADTILTQYKKRKRLFANEEVLPQFKDFRVIKAVQSMGGGAEGFSNWFEALNHMKCQIVQEDFDICLIACGAYGLPLASYVKQIGKQAIHMGGALQILFGIKGRRWDVSYEEDGRFYDYIGLQNDSWTRPSEYERPHNYKNVEGGCYW